MYLTGNYDKAIFKRAETTKPSDYLTKPFDGIELQTAIKTAINTQKSKNISKDQENMSKENN
jgi:FixJ family two-component response regulator